MGFKCISTIVAAAILGLAQPVSAEPLAFGPDLARAGWTVVSFPRIAPASFQVGDAMTLEIATNAAAGLLWRTIKPNARKSNKAQWSCWVDEGVPPTDLTKRGADDRVLGVYLCSAW